MNATPYLFDEIREGLLDDADIDEESRALYLVYKRDPDSGTCSGYRLILAPNMSALRRYIDGAPPDAIVRVVHLRFPGQVAATEQYFNCKLEIVRPES